MEIRYCFSAEKILRFAIIFYGFNLTFQLIASVGLAGLLGHMSDTQYDIFAGALIHEVAQVLAAGNGVSPHAEEIAATVKMIRVMILAPMLIAIGIWIAKSATSVSEVSSLKPQKGSIKRLSIGLQLVL